MLTGNDSFLFIKVQFFQNMKLQSARNVRVLIASCVGFHI